MYVLDTKAILCHVPVYADLAVAELILVGGVAILVTPAGVLLFLTSFNLDRSHTFLMAVSQLLDMSNSLSVGCCIKAASKARK